MTTTRGWFHLAEPHPVARTADRRGRCRRMTGDARPDPAAYVDLYWLPLGAGHGGALVRACGRLFETLGAARSGRTRRPLFHSALEVRVDGATWTIEMTPDWSPDRPGREVVVRGPVGLAWLGRSRLFRYEVHRWHDGRIDDVACAVDSPQRLGTDPVRARALLALLSALPPATWGRDGQEAGEMWNSNSLTAWLLVRSGHPVVDLRPPDHGRAPGWSAGLVVAARSTPS